MPIWTFPAALFAAFWDLRYRKVPNWLNASLVFAGLGYHAYHGLPWSGIFGLLAGLAWFLVPYALGGMGAGDVKLLAALGCCAGWPAAVGLILWTSISGGILVVLMAVKSEDWRSAWLALAKGKGEAMRTLRETLGNRRREKVPYAAAMAAGAALTVLLPFSG
jgi:prepilin peptidase CpaA